MPVPWQTSAIPLNGGLVTSKSPKALGPGQFAQLDNATFDGSGFPQKRHGAASDQVQSSASGDLTDKEWVFGYGWAPSTHILTADPIPGQTVAGRGLMTRAGDLLAYDGTNLALRVPGTPQGWAGIPNGPSSAFPYTPSAGTVHIPHLTTRDILTDDENQNGAEYSRAGVRGNVIEMYARVEEDTDKVMVYANDLATGARVVDRFDATFPTSAALTTDLALLYIPPAGTATYGIFVLAQGDRATNLLVYGWAHEYAPTVWTTTTLSSVYVSMAGRMDDDYAYIGFCEGTAIRLARIDRTGANTQTTLVISANMEAMDIAIHPDGRLMLAYAVTGAAYDAYYAFYDDDLATATTGPSILYNGTADDITRITCEWNLLSARTGSGEPTGVVAFDGREVPQYLFHYFFIRGATITSGDHNVSGSPFSPALQLSASAFRVGDTVFLPVYYISGAGQNQFACLYLDQKAPVATALVPCASWSRGSAESVPVHLPTPRVVGLEASFPAFSKAPGRVSGSLRTVALDFGAPLRSAQVSASTYAAGALVWEYDGQAIYEAGFLDVPRPFIVGGAGAGGLTPSSVYTYRFYLVHQNSRGEYTRSAAITQTVTLGVGDDTVDITLPPMPLCTRPGTFWEVYRSQSNGAVLTRSRFTNLTPATVDWYPVARSSSTIVTDEESDLDIAQNSIDPVPFGVLDNVAPPSCSMIYQGKDRAWYAGGDLLPGQVAYSKFWDPGETPAWNEALLVETDRAGPVTGIGFMGDWFVTMSPKSLYQFAGDGPSNLGLGDYTPARLISSDTGCISPDSVLLTPLGVAFQSRKGPRVMGQGGTMLSTGDGLIGSEVDPSFGTCVGACVVPEQDQARWLFDDGTLMVWDYSVNKWARWTGYSLSEYGTPNSLIYFDGGMVVAESDRILSEDTAAGSDGARLYRFIASLGWAAPNGALAWGRLRRWSLEGDALGPFTAQVFIDYDFKDGPRRQTYTWAASTSRTGPDGTTYDHDPGSFGSDSAWGAAPSWGGDTADGGAFPINVRFNRQKATSFRFTITDSTEANPTLALRVLSIEFAPVAGLVRAGGRNI